MKYLFPAFTLIFNVQLSHKHCHSKQFHEYIANCDRSNEIAVHNLQYPFLKKLYLVQRKTLRNNISDVYSETCQSSKMKHFAKITNA